MHTLVKNVLGCLSERGTRRTGIAIGGGDSNIRIAIGKVRFVSHRKHTIKILKKQQGETTGAVHPDLGRRLYFD